MRQIGNEVIWAGVASIVCGLVIASLLGGTRTPWLAVAIVVGVGFVATTVRRRRVQRAWRERYSDERGDARKPRPGAAPTAPTARTGSPSTSALATSDPDVRRAGARAESLGTKAPGSSDPTRPQSP